MPIVVFFWSKKMKAKFLFATSLIVSSFFVGCAASTEELADDAAPSSDAQEVRSSIVASWTGLSGPFMRITFTNVPARTLGGPPGGFKFDATIDTGIVCITAPCPSSMEVSGVYTVRGDRVTLSAYDRPSPQFARVLGDYRYTVVHDTLALVSASVQAKLKRGARTPHCVEYETTDESGTPLRNLYAINVDSYEAGKALLATVAPNFINESIRPGACNTPSACPRIYKPVCGELASGPKRTFSNVCEFAAAIRKEAGATGESKGHFEPGVCSTAQACTEDSDCRQGFCGWDAGNSRVCKPYSQVGERCEGFTTPAHRRVCAPGLQCVFREPTGDAGGICRRQLRG